MSCRCSPRCCCRRPLLDDVPVVLRVLLGLALLFVLFVVGFGPALFGPGVDNGIVLHVPATGTGP